MRMIGFQQMSGKRRLNIIGFQSLHMFVKSIFEIWSFPFVVTACAVHFLDIS